MSNPKFKVENYQNLGGINSKFSPHLTSPIEFLDIKNFDFQTPGSLTQRWGSTQYMGQTMAGKITALSEFQRLNGASYVITGSSGGLWFGATTGNFQGISLTTQGATTVLPYVNTNAQGNAVFCGWYYYGAGVTFVANNGFGVFLQGSSQQYTLAQDQSLRFHYYENPQVLGGNYSSIAYLVDRCFIANGDGFIKFDGATTTNVGLPLPIKASLGVAYDTSGDVTARGWGYSGAIIFYFSYLNDRGFESPIMPLVTALGPKNSVHAPVNTDGLIKMTLTMATPLGYGISAINVYSYCVSSVPAAVYTNGLYFYAADTNAWNLPFVKRETVPVSGSTLTAFPIGTTLGGITNWLSNIGTLSNPYTNQYLPLGFTLGSSNICNYFDNDGNGLLAGKEIYGFSNPYRPSYYPQFLETYDNRLFAAGFSSAPSTVWFSDTKEPEGYLPTNNFEVRTNDSDYITAMKSYATRLYIFKRNSFHVLAGDNPANFFVQEISPIYGCLNNRSVVIFENLMYFLDRKGVVEYTGANISFASIKVQPFFDRMNYNAALTEACAAHDKLRNQVLFAIPIDGSTTNNITLVYDYVAKAWTTHTGYNPRIFAEIQGYNNVRRLFCGDYSGRVNWFSASFLSDNGVGITLSYKTRYLHDMGDSVQKQFRRLYVNADALGSTLTNNINFYQDYGSSIVLGTTLNLGAFQERIEYGISAKSIAYELVTVNSTNSPLRIHGFTIESRMQRKV